MRFVCWSQSPDTSSLRASQIGPWNEDVRGPRIRISSRSVHVSFKMARDGVANV